MSAAPLPAASAAESLALVLADRRRLRFRPIGPDDRDGLAALFARLTPESRRRRFLSLKHELTPRELAYLSDTDHVTHEAIAAITPPARSPQSHSAPTAPDRSHRPHQSRPHDTRRARPTERCAHAND